MTASAILRAAALAVGLSTVAGAAMAACPTGLPPGVQCGAKDAKLAPAGDYKLEDTHASVIARVSHVGYSMSVFRFDEMSGTLNWNPADPAASKLSVAVKTASIATPVKGFAAELAGKTYLDSATFPNATFVSTAFRQTDATHGKVEGTFTLKGKSQPVTFDVTLIGAGPGFGKPRIGVQAVGWIKPQDYDMGPFFLDPIELTIDVEFEKAS